MNPKQFLETIYRLCLGREPDPAGYQHWLKVLESTGDYASVLNSFLESTEYAARQRAAPPVESQRKPRNPAGLLRDLRRPLRIVDVGAQMLVPQSHVYESLLEFPAEIIGFDPLEERLRERAEAEGGPALKLYPYAIGDGGAHTLYVNNDDGTSSLFPLNSRLNSKFNHLHELKTVETREIVTRRLDDALPGGPIDFLKLDVQGAELMILQSAPRSLANTAVVHCEAEFSPIYQDQPLFPAIYDLLTWHGFDFIDLLASGRYHYLTKSGETSHDRLIWGDTIFFRETQDRQTLLVQSVIADVVYGKASLAEYLYEKAEAA
ncbi:MAG TPA: FkbM family methyltransferase [Bryobacteraceae bacterium]|jgi:FkbM family methyltransferase|nr:FkbM family methyltransferase [Bryobacteraceae bacterium]